MFPAKSQFLELYYKYLMNVYSKNVCKENDI